MKHVFVNLKQIFKKIQFKKPQLKKVFRKPKFKKSMKYILIGLVVLGFLGIIVIVVLQSHVKHTYADRIVEADSIQTLTDFKAECILILGAGVTDDGQPKPMLLERLNTGLALYQDGAAPKIVVSGDHGRVGYDEVNVMKDYLVEHGVPSEDIFMDHAGFSTYESMYRMRDVFLLKSMIVVTQKYHLYRALYIANTLGIDSYGVACDEIVYAGQGYREVREMAARVKDYFYCLIDKKPKYLGDTIPVSGNGDVTNDKK